VRVAWFVSHLVTLEETMVKEIFYDLEFNVYGVVPLSNSGEVFLGTVRGRDFKYVYERAVALNLHVRFETAAVRDLVEGV
jgi:hypothetical protein